MKVPMILLLLLLLAASCKTVDMEKVARNSTGSGPMPSLGVAEIPEELMVRESIVVVEKPVFVPHEPAARTTPPASGTAAVTSSNTAGIRQPSEYAGAAMIYDFNSDWVYEVYGQPLRISSIRLEPGETVIETPFVSDSERWSLGAGVSYEGGSAVQYVYVRPILTGLQATLIINTNRRVYHIILRSFTNTHMPMVRWRYPQTGLPNTFIPVQEQPILTAEGIPVGIDPRFLSFDYRVTHSLFNRPRWFPQLVFDDGRQTFITFPKSILQGSFPTVFDNRNNVVNYRVHEHMIILDRLVEKATLRLDGKTAVIEKKR